MSLIDFRWVPTGFTESWPVLTISTELVPEKNGSFVEFHRFLRRVSKCSDGTSTARIGRTFQIDSHVIRRTDSVGTNNGHRPLGTRTTSRPVAKINITSNNLAK